MDIGTDSGPVFFKPCAYGVFGQNLDQGGSNASGKTSFVTAITQGLAGLEPLGLSIKDVKNRNLDVPCVVELGLDVSGKEVVITRSFGKGVSLFIDGVTIDGKQDVIKQRILETLGVTAEQAVMLTHKRQGHLDNFLTMKDSDKKEFLSKILDLDRVDSQKEQVQVKSKQIELALKQASDAEIRAGQAFEAISTSLSSAELQLESLRRINDETKSLGVEQVKSLEAALALLPIVAEVDVGAIRAIIEKIENAKTKLHNINELAQTEQEEIDRLVQQLSSRPQEPEEIARQISEAEVSLKKAQLGVKAKAEIQRLVSIKKHEIKSFVMPLEHSDENCTSCGQIMPEDVLSKSRERHRLAAEKAAEILAKKESELQKLMADFDKISAIDVDGALAISQEQLVLAKQQRVKWQDSVSTQAVEASLVEAKKKAAKTRAEMETMYSLISSLDREIKFMQDSAARALADQKKSISDQIKINLQTIDRAAAELKRHSDLYEKDKEKVLAKQLELDLQRKEKEDKEKEFSVIEQTLRVLSNSGFVGYVFEQVLNDFNNFSNEFLSKTDLMRDVYLEFSSDKVVKSTGQNVKSIQSKIMQKGQETSFDTLSGAEKLTVLSQVDYAIERIIKQRQGVSFSWKILDESFMWVDSTNKEQVLQEVLCDSEKTYLLVDHASEFNSALQNKIVIEKSNGIARVQLIEH